MVVMSGVCGFVRACVCVCHALERDEGVKGKDGSEMTKVLACQQDRGKFLLRT